MKIDLKKIDLNDDQTLFAVVFGGMTAAFVAVLIVLSALSSISNTIDDNIKYNRYNEALQEYKRCAKDFTDSFDVSVYCGDAPSSSMML